MVNHLYDKVVSLLTSYDLLNSEKDLSERYESALKLKQIRTIFEFETPEITDLSDILNLKNSGKVYAIRFDKLNYVNNHKKFVIGGLLLKNILSNKFSESTKTIIDGGNFSNGLALKYYANKFDFNVDYVVSRHMPEVILNELSSDKMNIIVAPKKQNQSVIREFYSHIPELLKNKEFRQNELWLKHPKYGGQVLKPFVKELIPKLNELPDLFVSCAGSGSILESYQYLLKKQLFEIYNKKMSIIVTEHEKYPLFANKLNLGLNSIDNNIYPPSKLSEIFYRKIDEFKTSISGPHYNEINPFLSEDVINSIDGVIHYSENDWQSVQSYLFKKNVFIGNSSAANIISAVNLANQGKIVLTPIFEPFRDFYKSDNYYFNSISNSQKRNRFSFLKFLIPGYGDYLILNGLCDYLSEKNYLLNSNNIPIVSPLSDIIGKIYFTSASLGIIFAKYALSLRFLLNQ